MDGGALPPPQSPTPAAHQTHKIPELARKQIERGAVGDSSVGILVELDVGVGFVIVNGVMIVKDGQLQANVHTGGPIRAPF